MHFTALTASEQRVLGCLIEKKFTTPDQYPLSINALRLAANQSTNRDPIVSYDDHVVNEAAQRLSRYGLVRLASGHSSRATKYRHLVDEALGVQQGELAVLCVLLLRGPQTPGELKGRTERMVGFDSLEQVDATLASLAQKDYAANLGRRPGQKEERWGQLLGGDQPLEELPAPAVPSGVPRAPSVGVSSYTQSGGSPVPATAAGTGGPGATATADVSALEARVAKLEAEVSELRAALGD